MSLKTLEQILTCSRVADPHAQRKEHLNRLAQVTRKRLTSLNVPRWSDVLVRIVSQGDVVTRASLAQPGAGCRGPLGCPYTRRYCVS